jgi:hypothetical protein
MGKTELVIQAADLKNISFRCKCGAAVSFRGTTPNLGVWNGYCPSGHPMNGIRTTFDSYRTFLDNATADNAPAVEFRIALKETDKESA